MEKNPDKDLYKELRRLSPSALWEEAAAFDRLQGRERLQRVAVVRAIGVVISESKSDPDRTRARAWLQQLLSDPEEKIRRYAMNALPKLGHALESEGNLIKLLKSTPSDREKKYLARSLEKIGGAAALELLPGSEQKIRAANSKAEGRLQGNRPLESFSGLQIFLRCRKGLEEFVADEAAETKHFRIDKILPGLVIAVPLRPFSITQIYKLRCFASVGFVPPAGKDIVSTICAKQTSNIFSAFNDGLVRYRLEFANQGHQRAAIRKLADAIYARCPNLLNTPSQPAWTISIDKTRVEILPRLVPDPRFAYRLQDVPAASHPPLAACLARLAGRAENEIVWDPFCGSGLELIERSFLGGIRKVIGTDLSAEAVEITKRNFASAFTDPIETHFAQCDFADYKKIAGLAPTLIITNPPMGKRVPIPNLRDLLESLFKIAGTILPKGGRLILVNPLKLEPPARALKLVYSKLIDMGGFHCRLEKYVKQ